MVPPLSKVDSSKLWCDIQNEQTVIYAKFGKDLFNISKVIGRKTKWPRFFGLPGIRLYLDSKAASITVASIVHTELVDCNSVC